MKYLNYIQLDYQHIKKEYLDSIKQIRDYFLDARFFVVFKKLDCHRPANVPSYGGDI